VFGRHVVNAFGGVRARATGMNVALDSLAAVVPASAAKVSGVFSWNGVREVLQALDFGVCLFFFLSGFLITRLLLLEHSTTGTVAVKNFYIRRCLRIWPLYFAFLALIAIVSLFVPALHVGRYRMMAALLFVANWAVVLHGWQGIAIQPLWSVSVEEQFYAVWPLFARVGRRLILGMSFAGIGLCVATLFYFAHKGDALVTQTWPNTAVQALFLSAGAITACLSQPEHRRMSTLKRILLACSGLLLWFVASAVFHVVRMETPGPAQLLSGYFLVLTGTYCIFTAAAGWRSTSIPTWLIHLGKISYGLYVFHVACLIGMEALAYAFVAAHPALHLSPYLAEAVSTAVALAICLLCALLSYRFLEKPFLNLKERFTTIESRPV
jgi:peptidoglycan/LPS O-acetylase OafA/YrhL